MTQPDKPVPARGARPQLFGEPKASKPSKSRHPDFGPSILATIDGAPRRDSRARDGMPLKRVLWMSVLALGVVAVYFAVKFGMLPTSSSPSPVPTLAAAPVPEPAAAPVAKVAKVAESVAAVAPVASAASGSDGAASIENVAVAPAVAASSADASTPAPNVAASLNNIQQVLARSEATESRKAEKPVAPKESHAAKESPAAKKEATVAARPAPAAPKPPSKSANDDTELLAAMLPHLKRRGNAPTSPAFEKRCGQLSGDAVAECRVKFCNGREGVDAACPAAVSR